ncbi:MAG: hypothetical protein F6K07_33105 [Okeania sp. SIO1H5]|nr:hypothetical protein [Okeania sp. SIO1H5]
MNKDVAKTENTLIPVLLSLVLSLSFQGCKQEEDPGLRKQRPVGDLLFVDSLHGQANAAKSLFWGPQKDSMETIFGKQHPHLRWVVQVDSIWIAMHEVRRPGENGYRIVMLHKGRATPNAAISLPLSNQGRTQIHFLSDTLFCLVDRSGQGDSSRVDLVGIFPKQLHLAPGPSHSGPGITEVLFTERNENGSEVTLTFGETRQRYRLHLKGYDPL